MMMVLVMTIVVLMIVAIMVLRADDHDGDVVADGNAGDGVGDDAYICTC